VTQGRCPTWDTCLCLSALHQFRLMVFRSPNLDHHQRAEAKGGVPYGTENTVERLFARYHEGVGAVLLAPADPAFSASRADCRWV
jgi:hypothetical protein